MDWLKIVDALKNSKPPNIIGAYTQMALSTLVYLPVEQYQTRLTTILGADMVKRAAGTGLFVPHVLVARKGSQVLCAFEGTRNWQTWALYAADADWTTWPGGNGTVYSAFLTIWLGCKNDFLEAIAPASELFLTGHSLGAAVSTLAGRFLQDAMNPPTNVYAFAGPRCVDADFVRANRVVNWSLDHPLDPVPRAPTNVIAALRTPSLTLPFYRGFTPAGIPWVLPQWANIGAGGGIGDDLRSYAASFAAPSLSLHQTFQYLGAFTLAMSIQERAYVQDLEQLLRDLGLYAPWP